MNNPGKAAMLLAFFAVLTALFSIPASADGISCSNNSDCMRCNSRCIRSDPAIKCLNFIQIYESNCSCVEGICTRIVKEPECLKEGETVKKLLFRWFVKEAKCCPGLAMIGPRKEEMGGIKGTCTKKCGNGVCDSDFESEENCPSDCLSAGKAPSCAFKGGKCVWEIVSCPYNRTSGYYVERTYVCSFLKKCCML
jgi:hypothetical protein